MTSLTRGQLAKHLGITTEAIRFYEQQGLVNPQRATNGYRKYDNECIEKLRFVLHAKELGLSLSDIQELLSIQIQPAQHTCQDVKNITQAKLHDIEQKILQLQHMHNALKVIHERCCGGTHSAENCTILTALAATQS
ncbi:Zn(2+)-responsive transcriptional regulator [Vibrio hannami]|uniref:Zn(2+)-responsive transcriptional regulator n=1 Tax=Vibrio hannami TaxID=2717094 RepID=UPI00240FCEA1|nr:Zn(2+)-responsive transcriptional regulator [Vibrio hannami]MDG3086535.1 Zn(2+)-responsive transcriptional regulator [Vibrio hannami]